MTITLSTCWYIFKAKFDPSIYQGWIHNMLSNVNNYHLVVYCDTTSYPYIEPYLSNRRIIAVIRPIESFSTYALKDQWIENHKQNHLLNDRVDWRVNMLWSEKLALVRDTIRNRHFESDYYGYCDIGYFRGRSNDTPTTALKNWPSNLESIDRSKIYYACVNNNSNYIMMLYHMIKDKNPDGLPHFAIPDHQISIAGGFFLGTAENLEWWHDTYYTLLKRYFDYGRLVKDDQIIVADGVFTHMGRFHLCQESDPLYDNWFLFQRFFRNLPVKM